MIAAARWRKRLRESGALLFILVQIQAGSPAFAADAASARQAHRSEGCRGEARRAKPGVAQTD
ncbi:hypothetical protein XI06_34530 [Bradyrhizobium sp. CCBAU 11434]|nr:hypothetical protein [Bradyrhizobium sp. CCBAU 11434]